LCLDHHRSSRVARRKTRRIEPGIATSIGASDSRHTAGLTHYGPFAAYVGPNFPPRQGPQEGLRINIFLIDLAVRLHSKRDRNVVLFPQKSRQLSTP
jgi:hypothetical protein